MRIVLILLFVTVTSCSNNDEKYIKDKLWTFESGVKLNEGDFIEFDGKYFLLKADTIFINSIPRATVKHLDKRRRLLHLKTLNGDSVSIYYYHDYYE